MKDGELVIGRVLFQFIPSSKESQIQASKTQVKATASSVSTSGQVSAALISKKMQKVNIYVAGRVTHPASARLIQEVKSRRTVRLIAEGGNKKAVAGDVLTPQQPQATSASRFHRAATVTPLNRYIKQNDAEVRKISSKELAKSVGCVMMGKDE